MKCLNAGLIVLLLVGFSVNPINILQISHTPLFNGSDAYSYLIDQCDFGPRPPGSNNLSLCRTMIAETFESFGWDIKFQNFTYNNVDCVNIIATWNSYNNSPIILGAHYDTRPPGPSDSGSGVGANDGASGVAVLLELASVLSDDTRSSIEIVLFDAEDSGGISGWDWIQGSSYYVSQLTADRIDSIRAMVLVDMVGDINLYLPRERSSTTSLQNSIWNIAEQLGHNDTFIDSSGDSILDDHRPFLDVGIPAVDIIQYPFPYYWHTLEDTPDKCSAESLETVGEVLEVFIVEEAYNNTEYHLDPPILLIIVTVIAIALSIPIIHAKVKRD
ncbi:MAG: M28 family peptidase [Candidatus Sifarchaeia archaeon]